MTESYNKQRKVKLFCPLINKIESLMVCEEQKVDLGFISRVFGLDPSSLKLNGHFLSRGIDLVASSVTWKCLLKYFSSKGLCTGKDDKDGVVVDGKLSKIGTKRGLDPQTTASRTRRGVEPEGCKQPQLEYSAMLMNKRLRENNSDCEEGHGGSKRRCNSFKRKQLFEDLRLLKKLKLNEGRSDFGGRECGSGTSAALSSRFKCSIMGVTGKRSRDDDVIAAAPCGSPTRI